jgi:Asp-tRNA(Asn)/Glu-tRNA(Gln) amidotransferase A subunit family amidase
VRNGPAWVAPQAGPPIVGSFAPAAAECRIHFKVTGTPAIAIPKGFTAAGLPLAMQIAGAAFAEPTVYRIAQACCEAHLLTAARSSPEPPKRRSPERVSVS